MFTEPYSYQIENTGKLSVSLRFLTAVDTYFEKVSKGNSEYWLGQESGEG